MTLELEERIQAPARLVFETVAHIENFRKAVDDIVDVEFVGTTTRGKGTVFRETRQMGKRRATVEMEVTEYDPPKGLRIVSRPDSMGTVWDSRFRVEPDGDTSRLHLSMQANSTRFLARLANAIFQKMIKNAIARDLRSLRAYCETQAIEG